MTRSRLALGFGAATLFMAAAPMALAQAGPAQPSPPRQNPSPSTTGADANEEITVTALRVVTNIQKTPVAVTAFNAANLKARNVQTLQDITRIAPGVRFTGDGNVDSGIVLIRGLGEGQAGFTGPAVQVYENDFNIEGEGLGTATYDIANIQVLKGPQGTLFGRNTLGGAILYNTVQPSYAQDGYLQASYGNYNYVDVEGAANATIIPDVLAVRLAGQIRRRDGWATSIAQDFRSLYPDTTLNKLGNVNTDSFRGTVLFTPTATFKNTLTFEYYYGDEGGSPSILVHPQNFVGPAISSAEANALAACNHECFDYGNSNFAFVHRQFYTVMDTATAQISPDISIKNIVGYSRRSTDIATDEAGTPNEATLAETVTPSSYYSEEFQLLGRSFDRFHWIFGAFYQHTYSDGPDGGVIVFPTLPPGFDLLASSGGESDTAAVFFNIDTDLTSKLKLHTGLRYTWDDQTICSLGFAVSMSTTPTTSSESCAQAASAPTGTGAGVLHVRDSAPTWTVGLDYQATDNLFFYITSRRGYRSGGANTPVFNTTCSTGGGPTTDNILLANGNPLFGPVACLDYGFQTTGVASGHSIDLRPLQTVQPEYITDVEIGMRSSWAYGGWRGRFNIQYFHYDYSNVAEGLFLGGISGAGGAPVLLTPNDPGSPLTGAVDFNGGELAADGVESDITVSPTHDLTMDLNVAYLDQRAVKVTIPAGFTASELPPLSVPTPKWALTFSLNYTLPWKLADGQLVIDYNYFWTDSFFAQDTLIPSYDLHNARLSWNNIANGPVSIDFFINNILDKRYITAAVNLQQGIANYGEPRMFGVDLNVKFH